MELLSAKENGGFMTDKLKPCPLCGNEADYDTEPWPNCSVFSIWCRHCTLSIDHSGTGVQVDSIKHWNTRPRESALIDALKELSDSLLNGFDGMCGVTCSAYECGCKEGVHSAAEKARALIKDMEG